MRQEAVAEAVRRNPSLLAASSADELALLREQTESIAIELQLRRDLSAVRARMPVGAGAEHSDDLSPSLAGRLMEPSRLVDATQDVGSAEGRQVGNPDDPSASTGGRPATSSSAKWQRLGIATLGVSVAWWFFFLVRIVGYAIRAGAVPGNLVIQTVDSFPEETWFATAASLFSVGALLMRRDPVGRPVRDHLLLAASGVALVTLVLFVWRLIP